MRCLICFTKWMLNSTPVLHKWMLLCGSRLCTHIIYMYAYLCLPVWMPVQGPLCTATSCLCWQCSVQCIYMCRGVGDQILIKAEHADILLTFIVSFLVMPVCAIGAEMYCCAEMFNQCTCMFSGITCWSCFVDFLVLRLLYNVSLRFGMCFMLCDASVHTHTLHIIVCGM